MTNVDRALLLAEWTNRSSVGGCSCCSGQREQYTADDQRVAKHEPNCPMDLALAERGFHTQEDRDRARDYLARKVTETANTLPPPEEP